MKKFYFLIFCVSFSFLSTAQIQFTEISGTPFDGVDEIHDGIDFADIDGDGDQDVLITGFSSGPSIAKLYRNDGTGSFTLESSTGTSNTTPPFVAVLEGTVNFFDLDNDGDQDVLTTGSGTANLYENNGSGSFTLVTGTPFTGVTRSAVDIADLNADGYLDILITGFGGSPTGAPTTELYLNNQSGNFTSAANPFDDVFYSAVKFADVDADGDQDVFISGRTSTFNLLITKLYTNNGSGVFTDSGQSLPAIDFSTIDTGDVDNDGDIDFLITGRDNSGNIRPNTHLYTNNGSGVFTEDTSVPFDDLQAGSVSFADPDSDGDLDVLLTGSNSSNNPITKFYTNDGTGTFTLATGLPFDDVNVFSYSKFVDIDGDNDEDLLIAGNDGSAKITKLYRNTAASPTVSNALNFDGSNDIVNLGTVIPASSSYTKEAWIYPENTSGARNIISSQRSPFWINNGTLSSSNNFAQAGSISINSPTAISINTWTHVAVTWDGTTMKLYVNGSEVAQQTGHAAYQSSQDISLGTYVGGSIFDGNMDEVRIWDVARTASEITNNKDTELVGNETGLLAYYNFNQGTAGGTNTGVTTLDDSTTNNNDGTLNNFALTGTSSNWVDGSGNGVTSTTSSINTVLDFGPNAADVTVGSVPTIEDFTLEFNFKPDGEFNYENLFQTNGLNGNIGGMRLETSSDFGQGHLYLNGDYGFHTIIPLAESLNNQWYHIAIVGDKTNDRFKIYLDGVEKVDVAKTSGWPASFTNLILAKGFNGDANRDYNGQMDEFRLWDVALDQATIQSRKDASLVGNESDLRIYYNFEEGTPNGNNTAVTTVVNQAASGGFNGTVNGLAKTGNESNWVSSDLSLTSTPVVTKTGLNFDGTNDYVDATGSSANLLPQGNDPFTVEYSVKTSQTSLGNVVSWGIKSNNQRASFGVRNNRAAFIGQFNDHTGVKLINDDKWHNIAITYSGSPTRALKFYVDGVLDATRTSNIMNIPNDDLLLGVQPTLLTENFDGTADNVRIWDKELTASEVAQYSGADIPSNTTNLVAYFNFEEAEGNVDNSATGADVTSVTDLTGNYNGTLINFARTGNSSNWVNRIFNEWEGTTDSDWATASNWSTGAVPVSTDNVLIPNTATQPLISSSTTANIRSITLATNTVLTVEGILNVDIRIVNDGQILFKSNSSKTGQLDALEGVISGNGTEKVERYIPAKRTFRLLSSAVGGQSFADAWQQDTHITGTGGAANGFDVTLTNNPSLFTFDNSIDPQFSSTESGLGWQPVTSTNNLIVAGTPYRLMVRGDRSVLLDSNSSTAKVTTLNAEGDMHTGSFSPSLATVANNFSFVGNPYQAVVDINATTRSNLTNFIYVWDASIAGDNTNGGFVTVPIPGSATPNPFSSDATQYVAPGQAFFVQNTASGNGSITFEEADKATAQTQQTPFSVDSEFYINSRLYKTSALNNSEMESDAIGLRFNTNYTTLGSDEDAGKLGNPGENYLIFNNGLKAIDFQNMPTNGHVVELALVNYEDNDYHLTFDLDHKPEDLKVYLNDTYLETQTEITAGLSYNFMVDANISESVDPFRFNISFEDVSLSNVDFNLDALRVYPNPVVNRLEISLPDQVELIEVRLIDLLGNQLLTNNEASLELGNLAAGIYLVQIRTDEGEVTKKIIKQ